MLVGLPTFVIRQYTVLMYVLEEHLDRTINNTTVVLIRGQFKAPQAVLLLHHTELAVNIAA